MTRRDRAELATWIAAGLIGMALLFASLYLLFFGEAPT